MRTLFAVLLVAATAQAEDIVYTADLQSQELGPDTEPLIVSLSLHDVGGIGIQEMHQGTIDITAANATDYGFDWQAFEDGLRLRLQYNMDPTPDPSPPRFISVWAYVDGYYPPIVNYSLDGTESPNMAPLTFYKSDSFELDAITLSYFPGPLFRWSINGHTVPEPSLLALLLPLVLFRRRHR